MRLRLFCRTPAHVFVAMFSFACSACGSSAGSSEQTGSATAAGATAGATSSVEVLAGAGVGGSTVGTATIAPATAGSSASLAATSAAASGSPDVASVLASARQVFAPLPDSFDSPTRQVTPEKIALGRQLYYETRLSKNQDLSCNSCHDLASYGVDARMPIGATSRGHKQQLGGRNSPTTYNAAGQIAQFWDGRAADVEMQAQGPVLNPVEMALASGEQAVKVLKSIPGYAPLFAAAFPGVMDPISFENAAIAIGAFERKLVTKGRFDRFLLGETDALTAAEIQGLMTFQSSGCAACHAGPELGGSLYGKLGVMKNYPSADTGRYQVTMQDADRHLFKVPTLRNIDKTAPYFHDGSLSTLEQAVKVMGEYQIPKGMLDDTEVASIVTFLKALTGDLPTDYIQQPAPLPSSADTPAPDPS